MTAQPQQVLFRKEALEHRADRLPDVVAGYRLYAGMAQIFSGSATALLMQSIG